MRAVQRMCRNGRWPSGKSRIGSGRSSSIASQPPENATASRARGRLWPTLVGRERVEVGVLPDRECEREEQDDPADRVLRLPRRDGQADAGERDDPQHEEEQAAE